MSASAEWVEAFDAAAEHGTPVWFTVHTNLVLLTAWLAASGYQASSVADAVEKPWHYEAEYRIARAVRDHKQLDHTVYLNSGLEAYCNDEECGWTFDAHEPVPS